MALRSGYLEACVPRAVRGLIGSRGSRVRRRRCNREVCRGDGTLTIIKETSPTTFEVAQTVKTKARAKTCTLDTKNNQILLITTEPASGAAAGQTRGGGGRGERGGPGMLDILVVGR